MKFRFKATHTIYKYFDIEADNESEALCKADEMLEDGEIRFDNEPYLNVEVNLNMIDN